MKKLLFVLLVSSLLVVTSVVAAQQPDIQEGCFGTSYCWHSVTITTGSGEIIKNTQASGSFGTVQCRTNSHVVYGEGVLYEDFVSNFYCSSTGRTLAVIIDGDRKQ